MAGKSVDDIKRYIIRLLGDMIRIEHSDLPDKVDRLKRMQVEVDAWTSELELAEDAAVAAEELYWHLEQGGLTH